MHRSLEPIKRWLAVLLLARPAHATEALLQAEPEALRQSEQLASVVRGRLEGPGSVLDAAAFV